MEGQASDIKIRAERILRIKDRLNHILTNTPAKTSSTIEKDTDRDYFMTAEEAKKYGLIDKVIWIIIPSCPRRGEGWWREKNLHDKNRLE